MSDSSDLTLSAAQRTIAGLRWADDMSGAGQGFRLLQLTTPASRGAKGGPWARARNIFWCAPWAGGVQSRGMTNRQAEGDGAPVGQH
jgi:hypothetical protein